MSERSRLDHAKAREIIHGYINPTLWPLKETIAAVDGSLVQLDDCVLPDPRIALIEALLADPRKRAHGNYVSGFDIQRILRGDA